MNKLQKLIILYTIILPIVLNMRFSHVNEKKCTYAHFITL